MARKKAKKKPKKALKRKKPSAAKALADFNARALPIAYGGKATQRKKQGGPDPGSRGKKKKGKVPAAPMRPPGEGIRRGMSSGNL